jgi:hypothetical protein
MAEALDTVYLGSLQLQRAVFDSVDVATVAHMVVGARRLRAETVMLVDAQRHLDTERLAGAVGMGVVERLWHRESRAKAAQRSVQDPSSEQSLDFVGSSPTTIANSAWDDKQVVVIGFVPALVSRSSLLHIRQFADSCGWPLAGFVTYRRHGATSSVGFPPVDRSSASPAGTRLPAWNSTPRPPGSTGGPLWRTLAAKNSEPSHPRSSDRDRGNGRVEEVPVHTGSLDRCLRAPEGVRQPKLPPDSYWCFDSKAQCSGPSAGLMFDLGIMDKLGKTI